MCGLKLPWCPQCKLCSSTAYHDAQHVKRSVFPDCSLQVRLSGKTKLGAKPGHPTNLSRGEEEKLVDFACNRAALGVGFGRMKFISFSEKFATKHDKKADIWLEELLSSVMSCEDQQDQSPLHLSCNAQPAENIIEQTASVTNSVNHNSDAASEARGSTWNPQSFPFRNQSFPGDPDSDVLLHPG